MDTLLSIPIWLVALLAGIFTYSMTAFGSAMVFLFPKMNQKIYQLMLGFASGVMIAASFWSLLAPAIDYADNNGQISWLVVSAGFILGALVLYLIDKTIPHIHIGKTKILEGPKTKLSQNILLMLSITIHNIPEGLAVGVAIGSIANTIDPHLALMSAISVALGIGIQNFPEGSAVSIPLASGGMSKFKAFIIGELSGIVEPIAAVIGAILVSQVTTVLPIALAFAAGAMIYVVVDELIPQSQQCPENQHFGVLGVILGFVIMMILDVSLG